MRTICLFFTVGLILLSTLIFSQEVSFYQAKQVAQNHLKKHDLNQTYHIIDFLELKSDSTPLACVFNLHPTGYIVVSSNTNLSPIIAFSFESIFGEFDNSNPLFLMIKKDLSNQLSFSTISNNTFSLQNQQKWARCLDENSIDNKDEFQQWPSERDGWLLTNWTQTAPFSNFCPMDPVTSQRSFAGCPATAMSQILNFHKTINGIHFTDSDDYFHNYNGRQFYIDDDFDMYEFTSFPDLNLYLDTLQNHWNNGITLTNNDKAALTFACGIAATQVYTSEGSGTFSVSQAFDAYQRFGCTSSVLIEPDDEELINRMAQNIKDTLPVHLAVVDEGWTTGHNVVVDGYNSDGYFHLNFGWGGSSNGWYLLPQEMPYNLTSFEGIIVDIMKKTNINNSNSIDNHIQLRVFPNPAKNYFEIVIPDGYSKIEISLINEFGIEVICSTKSKIDVSNLTNGIYFLKVIGQDFQYQTKLVISK